MCVPRWAESNFLLLVGSCEGLSIEYTTICLYIPYTTTRSINKKARQDSRTYMVDFDILNSIRSETGILVYGEM